MRTSPLTGGVIVQMSMRHCIRVGVGKSGTYAATVCTWTACSFALHASAMGKTSLERLRRSIAVGRA